jgi:hypothetical protein
VVLPGALVVRVPTFAAGEEKDLVEAAPRAAADAADAADASCAPAPTLAATRKART